MFHYTWIEILAQNKHLVVLSPLETYEEIKGCKYDPSLFSDAKFKRDWHGKAQVYMTKPEIIFFSHVRPL
jgi:hypothetical protein